MARRLTAQKAYPAWICDKCGFMFGRVLKDHVATYHQPDPNDPHDQCGWCFGRHKPLTEPRDFGYPAPRELLERKPKRGEI